MTDERLPTALLDLALARKRLLKAEFNAYRREDYLTWEGNDSYKDYTDEQMLDLVAQRKEAYTSAVITVRHLGGEAPSLEELYADEFDFLICRKKTPMGWPPNLNRRRWAGVVFMQNSPLNKCRKVGCNHQIKWRLTPTGTCGDGHNAEFIYHTDVAFFLAHEGDGYEPSQISELTPQQRVDLTHELMLNRRLAEKGIKDAEEKARQEEPEDDK